MLDRIFYINYFCLLLSYYTFLLLNFHIELSNGCFERALPATIGSIPIIIITDCLVILVTNKRPKELFNLPQLFFLALYLLIKISNLSDWHLK